METRSSEVPKPYSLFFHPTLTFKEKVVSYLIGAMLSALGTDDVARSEIGSNESLKTLLKIRKTVIDSSAGPLKKNLHNWSKLYTPDSPSPGTLAESSGSIPFRKRILYEWNIIDESTKIPDIASAANDREGVKLVVRFPSSLLSDEQREKGTIRESTQCLEVDFDQVDWRTFAPDIPIVVQFHPGALIIGSADEPTLVEDIERLVQNSSRDASPDVISICVNYGLAPENPFPLGIMDALSVIDFLLKDNSARKTIHISGSSAGANIGLVAAFEGHRRFPGRISSIHALGPYIEPASDTMSYYMQQNIYPSVALLRWGWRAYLGLSKPNEKVDDDDDDDDESELEKVLRKNSNYTSFNRWKVDYPSEALHRLVNPALAIPDGLNGDDVENAPTIIIRYNKGDPLKDDGKLVAEALRQKTGKNASFYEEMGLHLHMAGPYDSENPPAYWKIWADAVFGSVEKNE